MPIKRFYSPVTERDLEVLNMRADGMIFEEIAKRMRNKAVHYGTRDSCADVYFTL